MAEGTQNAGDYLPPHSLLESVLVCHLDFWGVGRHGRLTPLAYFDAVILRQEESIRSRSEIARAVGVGSHGVSECLFVR